MKEIKQYRVEWDGGCRECGNGRRYVIVENIDGEPCEVGGVSWGAKEEADCICELMNEAFKKGRGI
jgi:hypothetical protein